MKKLTRVLSLVGLAAISVGTVGALTACDKREEIVVSSSNESNPYVQQLIDEFCEANPEFDEVYKVRLEIQGEGDAATTVINDVSSAQDIFYFAQDQLSRLIVAGGLSELPESIGADVKERNTEDSVNAAMSGSALYAYPATADNGYFAYYDKSLTALDEEFNREGGPRQEELIKICEENNRTIAFNLEDSGWYLASYFIATGCESTWYADESGAFVNYVDTWNSDAGLIALQGAQELIQSSCFRSEETFSNTFSVSNNTGGIAVSGTWDSANAEAIMGDNLGVAPLWNFTVGSKTYHLGSFSGYKLVGVKPQSDATRSLWCHLLANYLTSAHGQMVLFENLGWGPSNLVDQDDPAVASDRILAALNAQNAYATPQGQYPNAWWNYTVALGAGIKNATDLQDLLDSYSASIEEILTAVQGDYAVTGNLDEASWSVSPVTAVSPYSLYEGNAETGTYKVDSDGTVHGRWTVPLTLVGGGCYVTSAGAVGDGSAGDIELGLFRVTDWGDWTGNWGYTELTNKTGYYDWNSDALGGGTDNNVGALPGSYTLVFDYTGTTPTLTLTAA